MSRHRKRPDGLPHRVYERFGTRTYSIGYKGFDGTWRFRLKCSVTDAVAIARLRLAATLRAQAVAQDPPLDGSVADLIDAWFDRQHALPHDCPSRRADTTLAENKREAENLRSAFGHVPVAALRRCDAYRYLDQCLLAKRHRTRPSSSSTTPISTRSRQRPIRFPEVNNLPCAFQTDHWKSVQIVRRRRVHVDLFGLGDWATENLGVATAGALDAPRGTVTTLRESWRPRP
jgi:hypothetical protein